MHTDNRQLHSPPFLLPTPECYLTKQAPMSHLRRPTFGVLPTSGRSTGRIGQANASVDLRARRCFGDSEKQTPTTTKKGRVPLELAAINAVFSLTIFRIRAMRSHPGHNAGHPGSRAAWTRPFGPVQCARVSAKFIEVSRYWYLVIMFFVVSVAKTPR